MISLLQAWDQPVFRSTVIVEWETHFSGTKLSSEVPTTDQKRSDFLASFSPVYWTENLMNNS